ncbi:MAG: anti-sigma factor family protein, partial [Myxococcales bacterium]
MACRERSLLWGYDAGELGAEDRALVAHHLETCDECRASLDGVRTSRQLLQVASEEAPPVDWSRVDRGVRAAAEKELQRRRPWFD